MDTGLYIRRFNESIALLPGAEIIDDWDGGCLIRSEEKLESPPGVAYYVTEGDQLVGVKFPPAENETAPYDYSADKDRSDTRALADATRGAI
jgi:hypothetical protein